MDKVENALKQSIKPSESIKNDSKVLEHSAMLKSGCKSRFRHFPKSLTDKSKYTPLAVQIAAMMNGTSANNSSSLTVPTAKDYDFPDGQTSNRGDYKNFQYDDILDAVYPPDIAEISQQVNAIKEQLEKSNNQVDISVALDSMQKGKPVKMSESLLNKLDVNVAAMIKDYNSKLAAANKKTSTPSVE